MPTETASRDQILREQSALAAKVAELSNPDTQRLAALAEAERELVTKQEQLEAIRVAEVAADLAKVQPALDAATIRRAKAFAEFIAAEAEVERLADAVETVAGRPIRGAYKIFGLADFLGTLALQRDDPAGFDLAKLRIVSKAGNRVAVEKI